jgi:hypothetical protein
MISISYPVNKYLLLSFQWLSAILRGLRNRINQIVQLTTYAYKMKPIVLAILGAAAMFFLCSRAVIKKMKTLHQP